MFEIAICDDSIGDRERLKERIGKNMPESDKFRIHVYDSGISLLAAIKNIDFLLYFLMFR